MSPTQERWLKTEFDDEITKGGNRYTKGALAATKSREYQIRVAKPTLKRIIGVLSQLADPNELSAKTEAKLWATLTSDFIDAQFWQAIDDLVKRRIVNPEINGVKGPSFENHTLWAQEILAVVVVPFLSR